MLKGHLINGGLQVIVKENNICYLTENPFRYRGYYYDSETGYYYLNSRYYSPEFGRFINADGQLNGDLLGYNLYLYCGNNPINNRDDSGQFWDIALDIVFTVGSLIAVAKNPKDLNAWAALGADLICMAVPYATGGGIAVRAAAKADNVLDAGKSIDKGEKAVDYAKNIQSIRKNAVRKAWKLEVENVKSGGDGISRTWTKDEKKELLLNGKVKGYHGHHMKSVNRYPTMAWDPNNIQFLTPKEHFKAHNYNWRNPTHGRYIIQEEK